MNEILWVEKYRPQNITDAILPFELKQTFQQFVDNKNCPNLLLSGSAGCGKTTVAKAMLEQLGCTYMMINGSEESGIDTHYELKLKTLRVPFLWMVNANTLFWMKQII